MKQIIPISIIFWMFSGSAGAHIFWLDSSQHFVKRGQVVTIGLAIGEAVIEDRIPRHPDHLASFQLHHVSTEAIEDVLGRWGDDPAGVFRMDRLGPQVASYRSHPTQTKVKNWKFVEYINEEGLTDIVKIKSIRGEEQTETFTRHSKSLLIVPSTSEHGRLRVDRQLGLNFEIILLSTLDRIMRVPTKLTFQILLKGAPIANRMVKLISLSENSVLTTERTNDEGIVEFRVKKPGRYLVNSVFITPSRIGGSKWNSLWTSETFEVIKKM